MDLIERAAKKNQQAKKAAASEEEAEKTVGVAKKKSVSLVERAAETAEKKPFEQAKAVGIGVPQAKKKRDPSSMNPLGGPSTSEVEQSEPEKPVARGIGIGTPNAARKKRERSDTASVPEDRPKSLAIGMTDDGALQGQKPKRRREQKTETIDLNSLREAGYITPDMPPNLMAEEFRIIKRSILLNAFSKGTQKSKNSNVVLVTSSNPGEGKSFCTINLALSIATEQDTTVLLIDADFSKPEVLNRLGVAGGRGLMDVVADSDLEVGDCLIRTNVPNLVLLPAGRQHNLTTELLASERMETIVDEIANRYPDRLVLFDSPPVLASSAASVLALYMGQIVFVIQAEKTTEPQIKESLNMVSACENISLLLNQTKFNGSNKKFATYYGYGGR